jgi:AhpD family alkylhydroperoxidase
MAIAPERLEMLLQSLAKRGTGHFVVGKIVAGEAEKIFLSSAEFSKSNPDIRPQKIDAMNTSPKNAPAHGDGCCADVFQNQTTAGSATESQKAFSALIRSVQSAGALDEKTKELILFSQVVGSRCQPCFDVHFRKARELGISQAELDEAAWCAIAMGGAPVKMFYQENLERLK